jgi:hypothetical protein
MAFATDHKLADEAAQPLRLEAVEVPASVFSLASDFAHEHRAILAYLAARKLVAPIEDGMEFCLEHKYLTARRTDAQLIEIAKGGVRDSTSLSQLQKADDWTIFYTVAVSKLDKDRYTAKISLRDATDGYPVEKRALVLTIDRNNDASGFVVSNAEAISLRQNDRLPRR